VLTDGLASSLADGIGTLRSGTGRNLFEIHFCCILLAVGSWSSGQQADADIFGYIKDFSQDTYSTGRLLLGF
jgi:hypothetical protein